MTGSNHDHHCGPAETLPFGPGDLVLVRAVVRRRAAAAGLATDRVDQLVLAVHEVAACAVERGIPSAVLWVGAGTDAVVCEVRDGLTAGRVAGDPASWHGARVSTPDCRPGRGLWLARALCDAVSVDMRQAGALVRLEMRFDPAQGHTGPASGTGHTVPAPGTPDGEALPRTGADAPKEATGTPDGCGDPAKEGMGDTGEPPPRALGVRDGTGG